MVLLCVVCVLVLTYLHTYLGLFLLALSAAIASAVVVATDRKPEDNWSVFVGVVVSWIIILIGSVAAAVGVGTYCGGSSEEESEAVAQV